MKNKTLPLMTLTKNTEKAITCVMSSCFSVCEMFQNVHNTNRPLKGCEGRRQGFWLGTWPKPQIQHVFQEHSEAVFISCMFPQLATPTVGAVLVRHQEYILHSSCL